MAFHWDLSKKNNLEGNPLGPRYSIYLYSTGCLVIPGSSCISDVSLSFTFSSNNVLCSLIPVLYSIINNPAKRKMLTIFFITSPPYRNLHSFLVKHFIWIAVIHFLFIYNQHHNGCYSSEITLAMFHCLLFLLDKETGPYFSFTLYKNNASFLHHFKI